MVALERNEARLWQLTHTARMLADWPCLATRSTPSLSHALPAYPSKSSLLPLWAAAQWCATSPALRRHSIVLPLPPLPPLLPLLPPPPLHVDGARRGPLLALPLLLLLPPPPTADSTTAKEAGVSEAAADGAPTVSESVDTTTAASNAAAGCTTPGHTAHAPNGLGSGAAESGKESVNSGGGGGGGSGDGGGVRASRNVSAAGADLTAKHSDDDDIEEEDGDGDGGGDSQGTASGEGVGEAGVDLSAVHSDVLGAALGLWPLARPPPPPERRRIARRLAAKAWVCQVKFWWTSQYLSCSRGGLESVYTSHYALLRKPLVAITRGQRIARRLAAKAWICQVKPRFNGRAYS